MLLEKGREVLHTARELEKQAVKLHQGWENALVLAWMHLSVLAAGAVIAAFYQQHTPPGCVPPRYPGANWQMRWWKGGRIFCSGAGRPAGAQRLWLCSLGELAQAFVVAPQHPLAQIAGR
jgi:hypothetical protein